MTRVDRVHGRTSSNVLAVATTVDVPPDMSGHSSAQEQGVSHSHVVGIVARLGNDERRVCEALVPDHGWSRVVGSVNVVAANDSVGVRARIERAAGWPGEGVSTGRRRGSLQLAGGSSSSLLGLGSGSRGSGRVAVRVGCMCERQEWRGGGEA